MDTPIDEQRVAIYLDQNVLAELLLEGRADLVRDLAAKYQVCYSYVTIAEIAAAKRSRDNYLHLLEQLDAVFIEAVIEDSKLTGRFRAYPAKPHDIFMEMELRATIQASIERISSLDLVKVFGGLPDYSFRDIEKMKLEEFDRVNLEIVGIASAAGIQDHPAVLDLIAGFEQSRQQYEVACGRSTELLEAQHGDGRGWSGTIHLRDSMGLSQAVIGTIEPPDVLQQVWDICFKRIDEISDIELHDALQLKAHPSELEQSECIPAVVGCHILLNTMGYQRDKKLSDVDVVRASSRDGMHAMFGAACSVFATKDGRLATKARACYEYLGIDTLVLTDTRLLLLEG